MWLTLELTSNSVFPLQQLFDYQTIALEGLKKYPQASEFDPISTLKAHPLQWFQTHDPPLQIRRNHPSTQIEHMTVYNPQTREQLLEKFALNKNLMLRDVCFSPDGTDMYIVTSTHIESYSIAPNRI